MVDKEGELMQDDQYLLENRELYDKVIETYTTVKHIEKSLESGKEIFRDHEKRIRILEYENQFTKGKLAIIILLFGGAVTIIFNFLIWLFSKTQR